MTIFLLTSFPFYYLYLFYYDWSFFPPVSNVRYGALYSHFTNEMLLLYEDCISLKQCTFYDEYVDFYIIKPFFLIKQTYGSSTFDLNGSLKGLQAPTVITDE